MGAQYETDEEEFNEMPNSDTMLGGSRLDTIPVVTVTAPVLVGVAGENKNYRKAGYVCRHKKDKKKEEHCPVTGVPPILF